MMGPGCSFDDPPCGKRAFRANLCRGHYEQKRDGKPLAPLRPYRATLKDLISRALERASKVTTGEDGDLESVKVEHLLRMTPIMFRKRRGPKKKVH